jgi:1-acyl-sn-glycerol-3-phosphate acyltransferase
MQAGRFARGVKIEQPGHVTPAGEQFIRGIVAPACRVLFRPTLTGTELLPESGPFLLVANHSAGVGLAEIACIAATWHERFGVSRPLAGFALPLGFVMWPLSAVHRMLGTVPSTYEAAHAALAAGVPLLVFPGGDHESLKPVWQADRVDFAGRVGFLRIARDAGVPIVPLGIRNGAYTAPIVVRGRWLSTLLVLPRLVGVKRWGISVLGLLGLIAIAALLPVAPAWRAVAAWIWLTSPLTFVPIIPATIRLRIGPALSPDDLFGADRSGSLDDALARVERSVAELVRRVPSSVD